MNNFKLRSHIPSTSPFVDATNYVINIKDVAYKNGDVDGTCKRAFIRAISQVSRRYFIKKLNRRTWSNIVVSFLATNAWACLKNINYGDKICNMWV